MKIATPPTLTGNPEKPRDLQFNLSDAVNLSIPTGATAVPSTRIQLDWKIRDDNSFLPCTLVAKVE